MGRSNQAQRRKKAAAKAASATVPAAPATETPISNTPIIRNKLPASIPFRIKPVNRAALFWTFVSSDSSQPKPDASCALFVTSAALEEAKDTVPWIKANGKAASTPTAPKLYEIRPSEGKGMGMFAIEDVPEGAMVFEERPVLVGSLGKLADRDADHEAVLQHALSHLSPDVQSEYMALSNC